MEPNYEDDLYISELSARWDTSSEAHKLAATTSSFSFIVDHKQNYVDIKKLPTHPEVRSWYVDICDQAEREMERNLALSLHARPEDEQRDLKQCYQLIQQSKTKRIRARKEASASDLRWYQKQFAEGKKN